MPKLHVSLPDGTISNFDLTEDTITVGRLPDNTIQIDDASVSSHHAQLTLEEGGYVLTDLDSTNGTAVNGQSHSQGRLQDGDAVRFGNIETIYASENPADAQPMPEESGVSLQPAEQSVRPANFENASPFQTRKKKKDPTATAIYAFTGVAILAFALAVVSVLGLKTPL